MIGTGLLLTLAFVLVGAAAAKLRASVVGLQTAAELAVAAVAVAAPARAAGALLALVFTSFAVAHGRRWRAGEAGCECFGSGARLSVSAPRAAALTAASAAAALAVSLGGGASVVQTLARDPRAATILVLSGGLGSMLWRLGFNARAGAADAAVQSLVRTSALALERRFTRRRMLERIALVGSALAVAPMRYLLYPGTALAAIVPGDCPGGLCTDGYTAFCCQITGGLNSCPEGTFPGGWWMCTDYTGSLLCADQGVRYYVDCNAMPRAGFPGGCQCAGGSCEQRRVACNIFRYGQCNTQIPGVTAVVCRMVMCENPSTIHELNCSASLAVDDAVCGQDAPCLVPPALELAGAGGV